MTCHQCELPRHEQEQEGQSGILGQANSIYIYNARSGGSLSLVLGNLFSSEDLVGCHRLCLHTEEEGLKVDQVVDFPDRQPEPQC